MAAPSVTYIFANSTTADATQVNQNFTDVINGVSDGTKDLNAASLTIVGSTTLNGSVSLGDGTPDNISFLGSLASTIPIKTNALYDFGSATLGLASIYLGSAGGFTTRVVGGATTSWTWTLPPVAPAGNGYQLVGQTSGVSSWAPIVRGPEARQNYAISTSVATNAMTVNLLAGDSTNATATNAVSILFRNTTAATGDSQLVTVTSALSVVISSGATLGLKSAANQYIYVWAMNNAGTIELCVSGSKEFDQGSLQSSTAMSGSATASNVLYGTSGRSSKPIRLLGRILSNQATSGTYLSNATEISLFPQPEKSERSEVWLYLANGYGSTNNVIRRFTTTGLNVGTAVTYADSATNGATFTINEDGIYGIYYSDCFSASLFFGISNNSNQLTTGITTITATNIVAMTELTAGNAGTSVTAILSLKVGDVIRPHTDGNQASGTSTFSQIFRITKIAS